MYDSFFLLSEIVQSSEVMKRALGPVTESLNVLLCHIAWRVLSFFVLILMIRIVSLWIIKRIREGRNVF